MARLSLVAAISEMQSAYRQPLVLEVLPTLSHALLASSKVLGSILTLESLPFMELARGLDEEQHLADAGGLTHATGVERAQVTSCGVEMSIDQATSVPSRVSDSTASAIVIGALRRTVALSGSEQVRPP